jgi:hypothetical protein
VATQGETLTLEMLGPSQYFFECCPFKSNPEIAACLANYRLRHKSSRTISFCRLGEWEDDGHAALKKAIKRLMKWYRVCVADYGPKTKAQLNEAVDFIYQRCP